MEHKARTSSEHKARAHEILKGAGYAKTAVHKHEAHMHKGEPMTKLARGGGVKPKSVNVIIHTGGADEAKKAGMQQGMALGAKMAAGAPKPPMGPPGAGAPMGPRPPMAPGGMPPGGMMNRGGKIKVRAHERRKSGGKV